MDLIEALLILPLTRCPVSLGINFLKEKALTRHLKKLSMQHQTPRVICCLRETKALKDQEKSYFCNQRSQLQNQMEILNHIQVSSDTWETGIFGLFINKAKRLAKLC